MRRSRVVKLLVLALAAAGLSLVAPTAALAAPVSTTTTLSVSPANSSPEGTRQFLTAAVTNGAVGKVIFRLDGFAFDQTDRRVVSGEATTDLIIGGVKTHTLSAEFVPDDANDFAGSTSGNQNYTITAAPSASTSTTLSVSPPSPIVETTNPTLTATISPAGATGSVVFYDGENPINEFDPVPVESDGTALVTTHLNAGTHQLTAEYTSDDSAYQSSTSPAVTYVVTAPAPAATPTSTSLTAAPVSPQEAGTSVTFTASITPKTAAGTVQLRDGTTDVGEPAPVTNGSAQVATTALTKGSHSLTAVFTPADTETYDPSTSPAITYVIAARPSVPASITATPGNASATITWTAPADNGGTPIIGYALQQSTTGGETWTDTAPGGTRTSTATSKVVTELMNDTGYLFRVAAINAIGNSQYAQTVKEVTPLAPASVVIGGTPASTTYGTKVTVTTTITNSGTKAPINGAQVRLYQRLLPSATFNLVGTFTANPAGVASVSRTAVANTYYRWYFAGTSTMGPAYSAIRPMSTSFTVSAARTPATVKRNQTTTVYGTVGGGVSGKGVYLQRYVGGKYTNIATGSLVYRTLPDGRRAVGFAFTTKLTELGTYSFRVYAPAGASLTAGYSAVQSVRST